MSAVITTFRRRDALRRAMDSVLAQECAASELLVVDNACEEEVRAVVDQWPGGRMLETRYIAEPKRGVSAARNRGLREARSGFVAFLDDDDVWVPDHLSNFLAVEGKFSNLALFGGLTARYGTSAVILPKSKEMFSDYCSTDDENIVVRPQGRLERPFYTPSMSQVIVVREPALSVRFDEALMGREDCHFIWRMSLAGDIVLDKRVHGQADQLEQSLFSVHSGVDSVTRLRMDLKRAGCGIALFERLAEVVPDNVAWRTARASAYFDASYVNSLAGRTDYALSTFFRSLRLQPRLGHGKLGLRILLSIFRTRVSD